MIFNFLNISKKFVPDIYHDIYELLKYNEVFELFEY